MQVKDPEIEKLFSDTQAIITNTHVVYTSGRHGSSYVNKDAVYVHTEAISKLCLHMANQYMADEIEIVAGPTIGGVVLSQWVAGHLNSRRAAGETLALFAEEEDGPDGKVRVFKRGYDRLIGGKSVVVVEDVLTTGGSARKVIEAVRALGGQVLGLSVLCNRGAVTAEQVGGVPIHALTSVSMDSYAEEECPLCKRGVPVNTQIGKGKAFLDRKKG